MEPIRHENQLLSQSNVRVIRELRIKILDVYRSLDDEVLIRQEVRDPIEGFVDWGKLQFAEDCVMLALQLVNEEYSKGQKVDLSHVIRDYRNYVKEHCEIFAD